MTMATDSGQVRFEGYSVGTEIWGSTQANFLVKMPGRNAKEVAVLLNDPTARAIAEAVGREDSQAFREQAARITGEFVLRDILEKRHQVESVILVSKSYFEEFPGLLDEVRAALSG